VAIDIHAALPGDVRARPSEFLSPLVRRRLTRAKYAYTTRYVAQRVVRSPRGYFLQTDPRTRPRPGDVVLARVVRLGQHKKLESPASRRAQMYVGDEIVVAYGDRYAPDQFEAEVPLDLGEAHLVAAGGVVGYVTARREGLEEPTVVQPLGLLHDGDRVATLADFAPYPPGLGVAPTPPRRARPPVVGVVGTTMNSGKSTALAALVRGLTLAGMDVAAGKATGTGAGGDPGMYRDAGATAVLDFTDFGHASTYRLRHADVVGVFTGLLGRLCDGSAEAVVVEIADGTYQTETARLLADPVFTEQVDGVLFTAGEALSAVGGVGLLRGLGIPVAAVTGRLTGSPLAAREARAALDLPVVDTADLCEPEVALSLLPEPGGTR
jgi:hypothetical protein